MSYEISFEARNGYLYVCSRSPVGDLHEAHKLWEAIARECRQRKFQRVLVEEDHGTHLHVVDTFDLATRISELGFNRIKVAFVDRNHAHEPANAFGETVAVNRGVNGRVCSSLQEAEHWLLN